MRDVPKEIWAWEWDLPGSKWHNKKDWSPFKPFWPDKTLFNFKKFKWEKVPSKQQKVVRYVREDVGEF